MRTGRWGVLVIVTLIGLLAIGFSGCAEEEKVVTPQQEQTPTPTPTPTVTPTQTEEEATPTETVATPTPTPTSTVEPIIGTWEFKGTKITFKDNGEYTLSQDGTGWTETWEKIGDNRYALKSSVEGMGNLDVAIYDESSDTFHLKGKPSVIYHRCE